MSLALKAGGSYIADPHRLLRDMRPTTWSMWLAMDAIDPWQENRADARAARTAWAVLAAAGAKREDGSSFDVQDFMPYVDLQVDQEALARERDAEASRQLRAALMNADGHKARIDP